MVGIAGDDNLIDVTRGGAGNNKATLNIAGPQTAGLANDVDVIQMGSFDSATITISGDGNISSITQQ